LEEEKNNVIDYLLENQNEVFHEQLIAENSVVRSHVEVIVAGLKLIQESVRASAVVTLDKTDLIRLRLAIRCFNSGAASLKLVRCGYWQPAGLVARDVLESMFLLDLFAGEPAEAVRWASMSDGERVNKFGPVHVRERLDQRDGNANQRRRAAYKRLSMYAAHPTPDGFTVISPNNNTITGPFCDAVRLKALIEELAQPMACVADIVYHLVVIPNDSALTSTRIQFRTIADQWRNRWLRNLPIT
jgi:hypothetical protein